MCKRGNEVVVKIPDNIDIRYNSPDRPNRQTVCIDECLADEIRYLWSKGVKTAGCCCGHGEIKMASILVEKESIEIMRQLGYEPWENPIDKTRKDGFKPKALGFRPISNKTMYNGSK